MGGVIDGGGGSADCHTSESPEASVAQAMHLHLQEINRLRQLWLWLGRVRRMHHGLAESGVQGE
jgi:hypothetical protein